MSSYSDLVQALPGLVSYWRLGEGSGTTATDMQALNNGTYVGGPTLGQAGLISDGDTSVLFPQDASKRVEIPNSASTDITTSALTIGAWVFLTGGAGTDRQIICKASGTGATQRKFGLYVAGGVFIPAQTDKPGFEVRTSGGHVDYVAGTELNLNAVNFVVGVYDGNDVRLYINGALVGTPQVLTGVVVSQTGTMMLGVFSDGTSSPFYGRIDEPFLCNQAITAADVVALFNAGQAYRQFVVVPLGAASGAIPYFDSTTVPRWQHLAIGATGDVSQVVAGLPAWGTPDWNNTTAQQKRGNTAGLPAPLASGQIYIDTQVSRAYVGV